MTSSKQMMLNSQCVFAQKNHLKTFFSLEPSTFTVFACCRIAAVTRTLCSQYQVFFFKNSNETLVSHVEITANVHCAALFTRSNSPKQCFLDVPKLRCPRVWVSFEDRHRSASSQNVCDELICRISCGTLRFACWALPFEEQAFEPYNLVGSSPKTRHLNVVTMT